MKADIQAFLTTAIKILANTPSFARDYCDLRMEFYHRFQQGRVFSTRFGADFFSLVNYHIAMNETLKPLHGEKLGEFDKNFNDWLKSLS